MPPEVECLDCRAGVPWKGTSRKPLRCAPCSRTYRRSYANAVYRRLNRERHVPRNCAVCNVPLPFGGPKKWCSEHRNTRVLQCLQCGEIRIVAAHCKVFCSRSCDVAFRRSQMRPRTIQQERRARSHARRSIRAVWRDGHCGLCKKPVDRSVRHPAPGAPTVDHIIPLSAGGTEDLSNLQLAHFACNQRKGAKVVPGQFHLEVAV